MKKYLSTFLLVASILACSKVEDLFTFDIGNTVRINIPASGGINVPVTIPTPDVSSNSESEFKNNNTRADLVKNVKLTRLDLNLVAPSGKTFSFIKSIEISISAEGLPAKKIAYLTNIPENAGSKLELETTDENLDEYIKKETYGISTEIVTREAFFQDVSIDADMSFKVTADIL